MRIIADLHIHSRFSRATSPRLNPAYLERWARIKGINLIGSGDCTHPVWLAELKEQLEESGDGCYVLDGEIRRAFDRGTALGEGIPNPPCPGAGQPRFLLSGEICTIYQWKGKTRRVHQVVLLPDFAAAASFQARLEKAGNIRSDGRPVLGIDSRDLLEILLETDERALLIPAHIWTPWFSVLGEKSGFNSIDECYRDLSGYIRAVETGLSSNPPMNWAVPSLDRFSIISNSDAHSPDKLGREATVFDMDFSFASLAAALSRGGEGGIMETIEFFPQEGKYHYDGHRSCGVCMDPEESVKAKGLCPVCGKPLTRGVLRRVRDLASGIVDEKAACPEQNAGTNRKPYRSLIPLAEILGELLRTGPASKKVARSYASLVEKMGGEFAVLIDACLSEPEKLDSPGLPGELLAAALDRMRRGTVSARPGFDGQYGIIRVFEPGKLP